MVQQCLQIFSQSTLHSLCCPANRIGIVQPAKAICIWVHLPQTWLVHFAPLTNTSCNFPAGHATEALPDGLLPATNNPLEAAGALSVTVTADGNHSTSFEEVGQSRSTAFPVVVNSL